MKTRTRLSQCPGNDNVRLLLLVVLAFFVRVQAVLYAAEPEKNLTSSTSLLSSFLAGSMRDVESIIYAARGINHSDGHWYANFGYYAANPDRKAYGIGGKLYRLGLKTGQLTTLLADAKGGVRDPQVSYDGKKILFSYRPGDTENYHLYELDLGEQTNMAKSPHVFPLPVRRGEDQDEGLRDQQDRTVALADRAVPPHPDPLSQTAGEREKTSPEPIRHSSFVIRQLTSGPFDDFEPAYLPDGGIVFVSSRCKRWVNCWLTQVAVLHRCDADGQNIRAISSNNEHDNTPWPLPDGRVLYTRWEYVDCSQVHFHHLRTVNPDGASQMTWYGNLHPGITMIDAKPIPGSDKIVASFSPGHGQREHDGVVTVVDPKGGPDATEFAKSITKAARAPDVSSSPASKARFTVTATICSPSRACLPTDAISPRATTNRARAAPPPAGSSPCWMARTTARRRRRSRKKCCACGSNRQRRIPAHTRRWAAA